VGNDVALYQPQTQTRLNCGVHPKKGVRLTITRMQQRDAAGMVHYYWSAIIGTERSTEFARMMREEGFMRFEEVIDEFRDRFNDDWLRNQRLP